MEAITQKKKRNRIVPHAFRIVFGHVKLFAACGKSTHKSDRTSLFFASFYVWRNVIHGAPARVSRSSVSFDTCWVLVHVSLRESLGPAASATEAPEWEQFKTAHLEHCTTDEA